MDNYFKHYPLTVYGENNTVAVNLFAKIAFVKSVQKMYEVFHPYTIQEGDRPETIAYLYYGDVGYDWIVYYSNNIVDPYYDWYMDDRTFKTFITEKYGSVTTAKQKVKLFRSNYLYDDSIITTATYDALTSNQKRFWSPVLSTSNRVHSYERKKEDVEFETNKTLGLQITLQGNTSFQVDEHVYQQSGSLTIAAGTVKYSNSSYATIVNPIGSFANTQNLKGSLSGANATVSSVTTLSTSIPTDIQSYFIPISYYDYESELNEQKKNIKLIDVGYVKSVEEQFKQLLSS